MTRTFNMPDPASEQDIKHMVCRLRDLWNESAQPPSNTKSGVANDLARCGFAAYVIVEHIDDVMLALELRESMS